MLASRVLRGAVFGSFAAGNMLAVTSASEVKFLGFGHCHLLQAGLSPASFLSIHRFA